MPQEVVMVPTDVEHRATGTVRSVWRSPRPTVASNGQGPGGKGGVQRDLRRKRLAALAWPSRGAANRYLLLVIVGRSHPGDRRKYAHAEGFPASEGRWVRIGQYRLLGGVVCPITDVRNGYDFVVGVATSAIGSPDATCVLSSRATRTGSTPPGLIAMRREHKSCRPARTVRSPQRFITAEIRAVVPDLPEALNDLPNFALVVRWSGAGC